MHDLKVFVSRIYGHDLDKLKMISAIKVGRNGGDYSGRDDYGERRKRNCWWIPLTAEEQEENRSNIIAYRGAFDAEFNRLRDVPTDHDHFH
jgi:hypothetical protein